MERHCVKTVEYSVEITLPKENNAFKEPILTWYFGDRAKTFWIYDVSSEAHLQSLMSQLNQVQNKLDGLF